MALQIGNRQLPLTADSPTPPEGSRLRLEILRTRPELAVRVLETLAADRAGSPAHPRGLELSRADAAVQALTRQTDPRQLLLGLRQLLAAVNTPPDQQVRTAGPAVSGGEQFRTLQRLLSPILNAVPTASTVSTPDGLARALTDSGLLTLHRLSSEAAGTTPTGGLQRDWTAVLARALLGLRDAMREGRLPETIASGRDVARGQPPPPPGRGWPLGPPPPSALQSQLAQGQGGSLAKAAISGQQGQLLRELPESLRIVVRQIEGAIARSELHQLASMPPESDGGRQLLWFELPVQRQAAYDLWQFQFQQHKSRREDSESVWTARIAVNIPGLGPFSASLRLKGERLSIQLHASDQSGHALVSANLDELRRRLRSAALDLEHLGLSVGEAPQADSALPRQLFRSQA
ncbi:flagellar hook-length control protein FliK [Gammaproteobacteria bacterium AB-CW1]|uniref:Flagellar hook-length control protein FliK n=1 Tax=Natronospira elongata TaxID=3110268 RepID=A0AAP6JCG3_9GAMM|nr:flagellar hook-length control protein FliK [Gammaproteobacteria bacterium AB-CW1]